MNSFNYFLEFYNSIYLQAHSNIKNKVIHFIGANLFIIGIALSILLKSWLLIPVSIFIGYFLPHIGHRHFQGNKSLRASNPFFCVLGAAVLYWQTWVNLLTKGRF